MNSDQILKELIRLESDRTLSHRARGVIRQTIQHIRQQDSEMLDLREDITDVIIPQTGEENGSSND